MADEVRPSAKTLEAVLGRALQFLRGVAQQPVIYALLASAGFTVEEYQTGWALVHKAAGYTPNMPLPPPVGASPAFDAMSTLNEWDEDGMRRIRSGLTRLYPEQEAFVFAGGLAPSTGPESAVGVRLLLDRIDALESGEGRPDTQAQDQAAVALLAKRGFHANERARLRALVNAAESLEEAPEPPALPVPLGSKEREDALFELYKWLKDWSDTAHSVLKKRAHLITLGLAKRRKKAKAPEGGDE